MQQEANTVVAPPAPDLLTGVVTDSADVAMKQELEKQGQEMRQKENEKLINMIGNVTASTPEQLKMLSDTIAVTTSDSKDLNTESKVCIDLQVEFISLSLIQANSKI